MSVFEEFQNKLGIYDVPTYSDTGEIIYHSITEIKNMLSIFMVPILGMHKCLFSKRIQNVNGERISVKVIAA